MTIYYNRTAVVTGAGGGLGRALALDLAARGARLAICDINGEAVQGTAALAQAAGAEVMATALDVTDSAAVQGFADAVLTHFGSVHQLYNNAGIGSFDRSFLDTPPQAFDRIMAVNLGGVVHCSRAFLPHLIASSAGCLVNISSLNGVMVQPLLTAYSTSKFAVRGFTEALQAEMLLDRHPVQVTLVLPGGIATQIIARGVADDAAAKARLKVYDQQLLQMQPDTAARLILDGVARGRNRIVLSGRAKRLELIARLLPAHYPALVVRGTRKLFGG
ncbi:MAG: SDR family oxidoreductase [Paracoccus sp. (in: a-proteobacteria)]|uniref:SDR family NAD(P)-dependent oxidoreductase n=1 Tax=Paracoccus sp. TaxID=267 RepID=UPI0026DF048D|nr:SDR family oxidoreductase [Paracoccus sp. (in: a-proteobacteria)]MDO5622955.1 SDR family oxidoreductase [Paracoccus sp. (in: a-proteobacteria)]